MLRAALLTGIGVVLLAAIVQTATSTVPVSKAADRQQAITPNDVKPGACAGLNLTATLTAAGDLTGTAANELILGAPVDQVIDAGPGDDCVHGGAGADTLDGGDGNDVCVGNATTVFANCETQIVI